MSLSIKNTARLDEIGIKEAISDYIKKKSGVDIDKNTLSLNYRNGDSPEKLLATNILVSWTSK